MKIVVCVKPVPDSDQIKIDPLKKTIIRNGISNKINEEDKRALEAALKIKETFLSNNTYVEIDIISMAPKNARENLLQAIAMGADRVFHITDRCFSGSDTLATAYVLSEAIKQKVGSPDLVITGNTTEDGGTGQVPTQLGEWLDFPHIQNIDSLIIEKDSITVWKKVEQKHLKYHIQLPVVIGVTKDINEPRVPNIRDIVKASKKPYFFVNSDDLILDYRFVGLSGSPTKVGQMFNITETRKGELISGKPEEIVDKLISIIKQITFL